MEHIELYKLLTLNGTWLTPDKEKYHTENLYERRYTFPSIVAHRAVRLDGQLLDIISVLVNEQTILFLGKWGDGTLPEIAKYKVNIEVTGSRVITVYATSPEEAIKKAGNRPVITTTSKRAIKCED